MIRSDTKNVQGAGGEYQVLKSLRKSAESSWLSSFPTSGSAARAFLLFVSDRKLGDVVPAEAVRLSFSGRLLLFLLLADRQSSGRSDGFGHISN